MGPCYLPEAGGNLSGVKLCWSNPFGDFKSCSAWSTHGQFVGYLSFLALLLSPAILEVGKSLTVAPLADRWCCLPQEIIL